MKQKTTSTATISLISFAFIFALGIASAHADDAAGKGLFTKNKCDECHSIEKKDIKKIKATSKAPDLSGAGLDFEGKPEFFAAWLNKEKENSRNKKHLKKFSGTKEDLTALTAWVATLKEGKSPSELMGPAK